MKQYDIILTAMLNHPERVMWTAKDFQDGKYFVGYEASARMSELAKLYPDLLIVGRQGRFRTLSVNWNYLDIDDYVQEYIRGE